MTSLPCAGFLKQFMGVCKPDQTHGNLAAVVHELSGGQAPSRVLCCGHSLGGALATLGESLLIATHLSHDRWSCAVCWPRLGLPH